ncbi:MAG TPA: SsrA-binding protein SmpB [Candidatus Paceibacterota bacterium]
MTLIEYKKAGLKFERIEELEAGIELFGHEVKALKSRQGSLDGSRIVVRGGQAYVVGMTIPPYQASNTPQSYDPERSRRLLIRKADIAKLSDAESTKGLTVVPIKMYTKNNLVKVRVAIVRGKGKRDQREDLKKRDAKREAERLLKSR